MPAAAKARAEAPGDEVAAPPGGAVQAGGVPQHLFAYQGATGHEQILLKASKLNRTRAQQRPSNGRAEKHGAAEAQQESL
jgi:hypothetical protein